ncbi:MAG: DUF4340 domain-containing protein [Pseudomonadota bacterium]
MLKKPVIWLSAVLAAQVVLAAVLTFTKSDNAAFKSSEPLASFSPSDVTEILIANDEGEVRLTRDGDGWLAPSLGDFPVAGDRAEALLDTLSELKRGWPVAENRASAKRFRVAEDDFERRIKIKTGDEERVLYFGDTPSFKQIYARADGQDEIFNVPFQALDAQADVDGWLDRNVLNLKADEIASLEINGVSIARVGDEFTVADLGPSEATDQQAVKDLIDEVARLSFDRVEWGADNDAALVTRFDQPLVTLVVATTDGQSFDYRFIAEQSEAEQIADANTDDEAPAPPSRYIFTRSDFPHRFNASRYRIDGVVDFTRDTLLAPVEVQSAEPASEPSEPTDQARETIQDPAGG